MEKLSDRHLIAQIVGYHPSQLIENDYELEALRRMSGPNWQPIETYKRENAVVLIWDPHIGVSLLGCPDEKGLWYALGWEDGRAQPTHWAPRPEGPHGPLTKLDLVNPHGA